MDHVFEHALFFIFDKDPQNEKLEATKNIVVEDTQKARNKLKNNPA